MARDILFRVCKPPPFLPKKVHSGHTLVMGFLGNVSGTGQSSGREGGQGTALEPGPEMTLEFRRERLSTRFWPLGLEMSNVWLGEELHFRNEKEVITKRIRNRRCG